MNVKLKGKCGRPAGNHRKYFEYDVDGKTATCKVLKKTSNAQNVVVLDGNAESSSAEFRSSQGESVKKCGMVVKCEKTPSNLKSHLMKHHEDIWKEYIEEEKSKKLSSSTGVKKKNYADSAAQQETIEKAFSKLKKMERGSPEETKITRKLALYIGGTNVPYSTVEDDLFRKFSKELNPRYTVPSRTTVMKTFSAIVEEATNTIKNSIALTPYVTVVLDLWTKNDQTPFLGLCIFYFDESLKRSQHLMLALRHLEHPHTGDRIYDSVMCILEEWSIPKEKILKIVTDNGSNVLKAFKTFSTAQAEFDDRTMEEDESENLIEEDYDVGTSYRSLQDRGEAEEIMDLYDHRLRCDLNIEDEEQTENGDNENDIVNETILDDDINSFDSFEQQLQNICQQVHLSCTVHTLQLVVKSFEKSPSLNKLLKHALKLVAQITRSSKSSTHLKRLSGGYNLLKHCPTRWSSLYHLLQRLLQLQEHVIKICSDGKIDGFLPSQWEKLSQIIHILGPFAECTNTLQATCSVSVSLVYPCILELQMHLEKMIEEGICRNDVQALRAELDRRFNHFIEVKAYNFASVFIVATFLDPRYKPLLLDNQKDAAVQYIKQKIEGDHLVKSRSPLSRENYESTFQENSPASPPVKKLKFVGQLLRNKEIDDNEKPSALEEELKAYAQDKFRVEDSINPIEYWMEKQHLLTSPLPIFACHYLTIPASSSFVESIFSYAGLSADKLRNKISDKNLEREVFLKINTDFF